MGAPQQFGIITDPDNEYFGHACMITKVTPAGWCTVRVGNHEMRLQEHTCIDAPDVPQVMRVASPENRALPLERALGSIQHQLQHFAKRTRNQELLPYERQKARGEFLLLVFTTCSVRR